MVARCAVLQLCYSCCHEGVLLALECSLGFLFVVRHEYRLYRAAVGLSGLLYLLFSVQIYCFLFIFYVNTPLNVC